MNTNFLRTILGWISAAGLLGMAYTFLGCTASIVAGKEVVTCSESWLPVEYQPLAVLALMVIGGIAKWWRQGTPSLDNLTKPTAVIDTTGKPGTAVLVSLTGKPGTVSPAQVMATTKAA